MTAATLLAGEVGGVLSAQPWADGLSTVAALPIQSERAGEFALQVLRGIYLGLLTGLLPAVIGWAMGFLFKYVTGISIPSFGVLVLAVALAGVNGGLLAIIDPAIQSSADAVTLTTALLVVMMLALYAHGKGDALGARLPRRVSLKSLQTARLSRDVIEFAGGREEVTVRVVGAVEDLPGYPPLPEDLRAEIAGTQLRLPADLPVGELESRVESSLIADHDLADAAVSLDRRGRATVRAAAPVASVSRRVPAGKRAVSVETLLPTGLAHHDEVRLLADGEPITGTVVSARTDGDRRDTPAGGGEGTEPTAAGTSAGDTTASGATTMGGPPSSRRAVTSGGRGRLTIATDRTAVESALAADDVRTVATARGEGREYELLSVIRRSGGTIARLAIGDASPRVGATVERLERDDPGGVVVLAVRRGDDWQFDVDRTTTLAAGDELFLLGDRTTLAREVPA